MLDQQDPSIKELFATLVKALSNKDIDLFKTILADKADALMLVEQMVLKNKRERKILLARIDAKQSTSLEGHLETFNEMVDDLDTLGLDWQALEPGPIEFKESEFNGINMLEISFSLAHPPQYKFDITLRDCYCFDGHWKCLSWIGYNKQVKHIADTPAIGVAYTEFTLELGGQMVTFHARERQTDSDVLREYYFEGNLSVDGDLNLAHLPDEIFVIDGNLRVSGNVFQLGREYLEYGSANLSLTVKGDFHAANFVCSEIELDVKGRIVVQQNVMTFGCNGQISFTALQAHTVVLFDDRTREHYYYTRYVDDVTNIKCIYFYGNNEYIENQPAILNWQCFATDINEDEIYNDDYKFDAFKIVEMALASDVLIDEFKLNERLNAKIKILDVDFSYYNGQAVTVKIQHSYYSNVLYFKGDITIDRNLTTESFTCKAGRYYHLIIDGDLIVNGNVDLDLDDKGYSIRLKITGNFYAHKLVVLAGDINVKNSIVVRDQVAVIGTNKVKANTITAPCVFSVDALTEFTNREVDYFWHVNRNDWHMDSSGRRFTDKYNHPSFLNMDFFLPTLWHKEFIEVDEDHLRLAILQDKPILDEQKIANHHDSKIDFNGYRFTPLIDNQYLYTDPNDTYLKYLFSGNQVFYYKGDIDVDGDFSTDDVFGNYTVDENSEVGLIIEGDLNVAGNLSLSKSGLWVLGNVTANNLLIHDAINQSNQRDHITQQNLTGTVLVKGSVTITNTTALGYLANLQVGSLRTTNLLKLSMSKLGVKHPLDFEEGVKYKLFYNETSSPYVDTEEEPTVKRELLKKRSRVRWSSLVKAIENKEEIFK